MKKIAWIAPLAVLWMGSFIVSVWPIHEGHAVQWWEPPEIITLIAAGAASVCLVIRVYGDS